MIRYAYKEVIHLLEEDMKNKLNYIGLNLEEIPDVIKKQYKVKYRPQNAQNEKSYKVYKYVNVNDIDILITPTNRLTDIIQKFEMALPLKDYLNKENEELYETFIKLIKQISIDDIEELDKQQKELQNNLPIDIKFNKDYLWQIYYSSEENKYFMLAPITETEYAELFYVLKEQLLGTNKKIYVPICYMDYTSNILSKEEIKNLENILFLFTNNWASIYEFYDISENNSLVITGKTKILETLQGSYIMKFSNRDKALEFYNLVNALFTLQTHYPSFYKFKVKVLESGDLQFTSNNSIINSEIISDYINEKYKENFNANSNLKEKNLNLQEELKVLKETAFNKHHEFLEKQKEISAYLECKKTILGRVKYFFSRKKVKLVSNNVKSEKQKKDPIKTLYFDPPQEKNIYTIQDLMEITSKLQESTNAVNDLELDIEAAKRRIETLEKKIENALIYIKEIDSHKKSLLDFWRFTSKDESNRLAEAQEVKNQNKIKKSFNINLDLEEVKSKFDSLVRNNLSLDEINSAFISTTIILDDLNRILKNEDINEENLDTLKNELNDNKTKLTLNIKNDSIKLTKQIEHRETERNVFSILNISDNTTIDEYKVMLNNIIKNLNEACKKTSINVDIPIYYASDDENLNGFKIFAINPQDVLYDISEGEINIHRFIVDEETKYIPLTNIVYFNNLNKTLPLGMDCRTKILVNTNNIDSKRIEKETNNILTFKGDKISILKVNIYNYL